MTKGRKGVRSITNKLLAMKFASEFMLIYPIFTIMFGERGGVNATGIGMILATTFIAGIAFEIPTGVIADKIPRKFVITGAIVSKAVALLLWLLFPFFAGYLAGAVFLALGTALESGALQAYLYSELGEESKKSFGRFWARVSAMVMISYTVAYILTTIIGVRYELLLVLSIMACFVALVIAFTLPTDKIGGLVESEKPKIFKSALEHILHSPELIKLLLSSIIVVSLAQVVIEYISLYYNQAGIVTRYVPLMMAAGNIIGAILFWTLHSWDGFLEKYKVWLMVVATTLFALSFRGSLAVVATGILIYTRYIRVLQVQFESNIQHLSSDKARATIASISSFASSLIAAFIVLLVGHFAKDNLIIAPLRVALVMGACIFVCVHGLIRYKRSKTTQQE